MAMQKEQSANILSVVMCNVDLQLLCLSIIWNERFVAGVCLDDYFSYMKRK